MLLKIILVLSVIVLITIILLVINYTNRKNVFQMEKMTNVPLSQEIFKQNFPNCKFDLPSYSYGILCDNLISCKITDNLIASPIFYYEKYPKDCFQNGFFFVNLDMTDFSTLKENSPNFVLCKTKQTEDIVKNKFPDKKIFYTGFTSIERHDPNIEKDFNQFIHISGKSAFKGTKNLLKYWTKHPEWPMLSVLAYDSEIVLKYKKILQDKKYKNINLIVQFLNENEMNKLYNNFGLHICCSEHEGFGHYLHEAKSSGAVVLYTDAPPMNENFINGENGIGISCELSGTTKNGWCPKYSITEQGLEKAVNKVLSMTKTELSDMGKKARNSFLQERELFRTRLTRLILGEKTMPKKIHYIWLSNKDQYTDVELPQKYNKYVQTWQKHNPDFELLFWSGDKIFQLVKQYFPQYVDFYKNLPLISKCDFGRFVIVYIYGGIYTDVDFICKKNLSDIIQGENYFVLEPEKHSLNVNGARLVANGFFGSVSYSKLLSDWISQMVLNKSNNILEKTGPIGLYKFLKNTKEKVLFGNTCDVIPFEMDGKYSNQCYGNYNHYMVTLWRDGSAWGSDYNNINNDMFNYKHVKNPINDELLYYDEIPIIISNDIKSQFDNFLQNKTIIFEPNEALIFSQCLKDEQIYFYSNDIYTCNSLEYLSLLNSIGNLNIIYANNFVNFLDNSKLFWENTGQVWTTIFSDINIKNSIYKLAQTLKPQAIIIEMGANNGELVVILAQALNNIGRSDIKILAQEKNKNKSDFITKISWYNQLGNVYSINTENLSEESFKNNNLSPSNSALIIINNPEDIDKIKDILIYKPIILFKFNCDEFIVNQLCKNLQDKITSYNKNYKSRQLDNILIFE
jgi:mannosyltransferase OCH1-like enzyme